MIPQLSLVAIVASLASGPVAERHVHDPVETVSVSELSAKNKKAVSKLLAKLRKEYKEEGREKKGLAAPPEAEELKCTLYPNGFECSHENYWVSCNWIEGWCQAADDWPG